MEGIEFYTTPNGDVRYKPATGSRELRLTAFSTEIITKVLELVRKRFPACYARLVTLYAPKSETPSIRRMADYEMASRFIRCNFGEHDLLTQDIEHEIMRFEEVRCPLRGGFCPDENVICKPKGLIRLSSAEKPVVDMYLMGYTFDEIADELGKSPNTVKSQLHSVKGKLGVRNCREIIKVLRMSNV